MFNIFPKKQDFFTLFESAAQNLYEEARLLKELMEDYSNAEEKTKKICELEDIGDSFTHETIRRLHRTFLTPLDREDIHGLIGGLDDIVDLIDGSADRMLVFKVNEPTKGAKALANLIFATAGAILNAVSCLKKKNYKCIIECCIKINQLENEGDRIYRDASATLFDNEEKNPIFVIRWMEIYENMENALDRCEDVANILEGIVLKHA